MANIGTCELREASSGIKRRRHEYEEGFETSMSYEPSTPSLFEETFSNSTYPVLDRLCDFLEIQDLINLTRTCKQYRNLLHDLKASKWNVNRLLSRYVKDPQDFRSVMARSEALVSGSAALQFFDRVVWPESDLDVFIEYKTDEVYRESAEQDSTDNIKRLGTHLMEKEGYHFISSRYQSSDFYEAVKKPMKLSSGKGAHIEGDTSPPWTISEKLAQGFHDDLYRNHCMAGVYTFIKENVNGSKPLRTGVDASGFGYDDEENDEDYKLLRSKRKIQIVATNMPPLLAILVFHSSIVMNFFTWNKAYSLFPLPTFVHRRAFVTQKLDVQMRNCLTKYSVRGWRFQMEIWPEQSEGMKTKHPMLQKHRLAGDKFSWTMDLDTTGVDPGPNVVPTTVLDLAGFSGGPSYEMREFQQTRPYSNFYYCYTSRLLSSHVLQYKYLVGEKKWLEFLLERLMPLQWIEKIKLDPNELERLPNYWYNRAQRPEGWTYWDEEVPKWRALYEVEKRVSEETDKVIEREAVKLGRTYINLP